MVAVKKLPQNMSNQLEKTSGRRRIRVTTFAVANSRGTSAIVGSSDDIIDGRRYFQDAKPECFVIGKRKSANGFFAKNFQMRE
ncbi:MAG: hypothetical protein ACHQ1H_03495 [Nitrososphaerales archaeon]